MRTFDPGVNSYDKMHGNCIASFSITSEMAKKEMPQNFFSIFMAWTFIDFVIEIQLAERK